MSSVSFRLRKFASHSDRLNMVNLPILPDNHEFTSLVQDLLDHTSSVIYVKDLAFRYLLINRQFETMFHVSRAEILGKTDFDLFSSELAQAFRVNDAQVIESGEPLQCEETAPQDDGLHRYFSLKFPLRDASGTIYAMAGISTDITDRVRAQREIAFLNHRQHQILGSVADGVCHLDADGKVLFLNPAGERMLQRFSSDVRGLAYSEFVGRSKNGTCHEAAGSNPIEIVLNGLAEMRIQDGHFRRRDGSAFPVEYTVIPVHDMGITAGVVVTFRDTSERLKHLETEQEIQTAQMIQISMVPKQVPSIPGFDFAAISVPCSKACGDYFDFIPCGEGHLGVVVGDVSGHGLGAALEMVETRAILRTTMLTERDPVQCMSRLNQILSDDLPDDMFVTLFLCILNTDNRTLTYSSAGHDAIYLRADGTERRLSSTGAVLGLNRSTTFTSDPPISLQSGDILLIATDGMAETLSPSHQLFGRSRLTELLRQHRSKPASEIIQAIRAAVDSFRGPEAQRDDMTAAVIKVV